MGPQMTTEILAIDSITVREFRRIWRLFDFRALQSRLVGNLALAASYERRAKDAHEDMLYYAQEAARLKFLGCSGAASLDYAGYHNGQHLLRDKTTGEIFPHTNSNRG